MSGYTLYTHQVETLERYRKQTKTINGSQPGTGKTLSALIRVKELNQKTVVVCPSYLTRNWVAEFKKFVDVDATIYPKMSQVTIVSVDSLYKSVELFHNANVVVVDEAHTVTSPKARRTKALHQAIKLNKPEHVILMSGTPMRNRVTELYSLLLLVYYNTGSTFMREFPNPYTFNMRFTNRIVKRFGGREIVAFEGLRNLPELMVWLKPVHFRYTLEAIHDLPAISFKELTVDSVNDKETEIILEKGWLSLMENKSILKEHITSAKLQSELNKVPAAVTVLKDMMESEQGPLVVFSDHVMPAEKMAEQMSGYRVAIINGATPIPKRNEIVSAFQEGKLDILFGTIRACGTGITLTRSNTVLFLGLSWVPADNEQAVGRIRRISQKVPCRAITLVAEGFDKKISSLLLKKEKILAEVFKDS